MTTTVRNIVNNNGNTVPNQFIITTKDKGDHKEVFQSYKTLIAEWVNGQVTIDDEALNYSRTTNIHLYSFLGMKRKEIEAKVASGEIKTRNMNKQRVA